MHFSQSRYQCENVRTVRQTKIILVSTIWLHDAIQNTDYRTPCRDLRQGLLLLHDEMSR